MYLHVASLDFTNGWVEIVGQAIGGSKHVQMLQLLDDEDESANNSSLFFNLIATNRTIELWHYVISTMKVWISLMSYPHSSWTTTIFGGLKS